MSTVGARVRLRRSGEGGKADSDDERVSDSVLPAEKEEKEQATENESPAVSSLPFVLVFLIGVPAYVCAWALTIMRSVTG
jgi:hypothetical protein